MNRMNRSLLTLILIAAMPLQAATLEAGIRHLSLSPMTESDIDVVSSRGFAATAEVFWTPHVSTQFAGTFVNPAAFLEPDDFDLGTLGMDIYSAGARWHFAPARRWSPFAGAGVALVTFGDLEDRFGEDLAIEVGNETTFFAEAGLRYEIVPNLFLDAAVSYMPLEASLTTGQNDTSRIIPSTLPLDPMTVSVGAAWRFGGK